MPTAMPGSTSCSPATGSPKPAVGRMSDASSSTSTPLRPRRSPRKRSTASASSTTSSRRSRACRSTVADKNARKLRKSELAAAFRYMRGRRTALGRCFDDGRLALDNNPAERALRCVAIGRKNYFFAGSDAGGHRAAAMYSLIESAKLNRLDPQSYLTDVLARIADHPARAIAELLPWRWQPIELNRAA